jgi:UDP-N-acetylmuramoyl-L-alanyl-D-glutamate--2,6-diaminopimelate ligase
MGGDAPDVEITGLHYRSSDVRPGGLFFCVPGATRDGHDLANEAVAAGAVALVVERPVDADVPQLVVESVRASMAVAADTFFGTPTDRLTVAGVTGTNGKTTTAYLLHSILQAEGRPTGLVGTVEWIVGGESRDAPHTTPEAIDLQALFRDMLVAGDDLSEFVLTEMGPLLLDEPRLGADRLAGLLATRGRSLPAVSSG